MIELKIGIINYNSHLYTYIYCLIWPLLQLLESEEDICMIYLLESVWGSDN